MTAPAVTFTDLWVRFAALERRLEAASTELARIETSLRSIDLTEADYPRDSE